MLRLECWLWLISSFFFLFKETLLKRNVFEVLLFLMYSWYRNTVQRFWIYTSLNKNKVGKYMIGLVERVTVALAYANHCMIEQAAMKAVSPNVNLSEMYKGLRKMYYYYTSTCKFVHLLRNTCHLAWICKAAEPSVASLFSSACFLLFVFFLFLSI